MKTLTMPNAFLNFCRPGLALVISSILLLAACSKLTEANLQKVHNGMTTDEVKAVLGTPTDVKTYNGMGLVSGTTYLYHTNSSNVKVTFVNDKVIAMEGEFK